MAFQAPTRSRHQLPPAQSQQQQQQHQQQPQQPQLATSTTSPLTAADTEEWIVFSPSTVAETATISGTRHSDEDLGSILTTSSGQAGRHDLLPGSFDEGAEDHEEEDEGSYGAETDSLQAFQDLHGRILLPTHDGLGSFDTTPGPYRSLEESLRIIAAAGRTEDTTERIQRWRMEQSHAFIEEIERATRRRRHSIASKASGNMVDVAAKAEEEVASMSGGAVVGDGMERREGVHSESFWKRITRSFIRDIIGLDDTLLEVLFGEALPVEALEAGEKKFKKDAEDRILDRIAKELGDLVHLYASHPAGSSARTVLALENKRELEEADGTKTPQPQQSSTDTQTPLDAISMQSPSGPRLQPTPTLDRQGEPTHGAIHWGLEEESDAKIEAQLRKEYWEQELDLRLVFSYLKSRFSRPRPPPPISPTPTSLRYHHPLINRACRASPYPRRPAIAPSAGAATVCGAQERQAHESKASSRSKGYFWDIATSVGSGKTGSCVGTGVWAAI